MIRVKQVEVVSHITDDSSVLFVKFDFDKYSDDIKLFHSFVNYLEKEYRQFYSVLNCSNFTIVIALDELPDFAILDFTMIFTSWIIKVSKNKKNKGVKK